MKFKFLIPFLCLLCIVSCSHTDNKWQVESPSGKIAFNILLNDSNQLTYNVTLKSDSATTEVIGISPLGLQRADADFYSSLQFVDAKKVVEISESFTLPTGKQKQITSKGNELILTFKNDKGAKIEIIARAYNDGVAFRYRFPEEDSKTYTVTQELTGFTVNSEAKAWLQPYDKATVYSPGYEKYFENGISVGTVSPNEEGWCFPALFETKNAWLLITEADIDENYFGSHLQPQSPNGTYSIRFPETGEALGLGVNTASATLPWQMPWRVIMVGTKLSDVVESNLVVELSPASKITDASWIKPGRSSWSWWSEPDSPRNFDALKKHVDFAAGMSWEYSLVDANWDLMKGGNIEQLVQYANSKNVGILMWYNSGGPNNSVTERPRDIMNNPEKRKEEFKKLAAWGVKGVKVDFFQTDKQFIMKEYIGILEDAANNNILVNFHGCTLPRGWNRTWPNLVSMEAVRGGECYIFDKTFPEMAVVNNTIYPFTRNVVGSMDYTPVTFSDNTFPHLTSYGHELALSIVFESGIMHFADRVGAYNALPVEPMNFLKTVPVTWDKSMLLEGYPGKYCVMARQSNGVWYIGGINGTNEKMSLDIDLSRLEGGYNSAFIIADGKNNKEFASSEVKLNAGDKLKVELLPAGGFVTTLK